MCDRPWCTCEVYDDVEAERDRLREALERIAARCGDDSDPQDNPVQIARKALNEQ